MKEPMEIVLAFGIVLLCVITGALILEHSFIEDISIFQFLIIFIPLLIISIIFLRMIPTSEEQEQ